MRLQDLQKNYYFKFQIKNKDAENLLAITEVIRRKDEVVVDGVKTSIDIQETNDWILGSQTEISLTPWDWEKLIDQTKRYHLDYFAQRIPIDNFYPLNSSTVIEPLYR